MTTILDVAKLAQVSPATVSRTISRPDRVNEAMRKRVVAAIAKLGYQPNQAARSLRTLKTLKLLVSVPDISNPFFAKVIRGAEEAARAAGYAVVLGDTRSDPEVEAGYAGMLRQREVDGFIFLGHRVPEPLVRAGRAGGEQMPIVHGCEYSPGLGVSSVHIDNVAAGADAARHLIELGHRHIALVSGPLDSPLSRDRLAGVMRELNTHGLPAPQMRSGDFVVETGFDAVTDLLADGRVTAIFCFSDEIAIGALRAIHLAGLSCPGDISLIGCDDIRLAGFLNPALTTIAQPGDQIGRRAVRMLLDIIEGNQQTLESVTLPHRLVVRESTGKPNAARRDRPAG